MTGWVATVTASTSATDKIDAEVIDDYISSVAGYYGVDTSDVIVSTTYGASGSMSMTIPSDVSEDELVDVITASIANSLGVHPQDVNVSVDMETGVVEFTVTSENFNDAAADQFDLSNDQYKNDIIATIENALPSVTVDDYGISDDVVATIEFTVDADKATNDLTQAAFQTEELFSSFADVDVSTSYLTQAPTMIPSLSPTTSLPSAAPSITGM